MKVRALILTLFLMFFCAPAATAGLLNEKAPEFTLQDTNGKSVSLKDFRGKVVFIDFWASWCPPCKKEFPEINKFMGRYKPQDAVFLAINIDRTRSLADGFLSQVPALSNDLHVLLDPESSVIREYNAAAMPTSFIIDRGGVVRNIHLGYREKDPESWAEEIDGLLKR